MSLFRNQKQKYPQEQLELHKTALELKGISIKLQNTVDDLRGMVSQLKDNSGQQESDEEE